MAKEVHNKLQQLDVISAICESSGSDLFAQLMCNCLCGSCYTAAVAADYDDDDDDDDVS